MESVYRSVMELIDSGEMGALCTIMNGSGSIPRHAGSKMLVYPDGHFTGTVGGGEVESRVISEALDVIHSGKSRVLEYKMVNPQQGDPGVCGGTLQVFVEPVLPKPRLLIIGGGHVGKAVAHLAKWLGFRVAVSDDRPEFCTKEENPDADEFYPVAMDELPALLKITPQTYIILTTRGSAVDVKGMPVLLNSPFGYLGVIGSRRRWALTRKGLLEQGFTEEHFARVHSPIGLELNAETPEEIAVSIMAQVILARNGGTGTSMKA
jgi:xanthine dehydrogenase accessory factor